MANLRILCVITTTAAAALLAPAAWAGQAGADESLELQMARGLNWQPQAGAIDLLRAHKRALSRGDAAGAVAMLAEDVRYVAGAYCPAAQPCIGKEQVLERLIKPLIARKMRIDTGAAEGGDELARVRLALSWPGIEERGAQRLIGVDEVRARDGRIVSITYAYDLSDAQTTAFVKASTPATAAVAVTPAGK